MSVCGQAGQTEEDTASEEAGAATRELHKQKPASKVVRVLTVLAYLLSVSLAAILLSVYYVCAWTSPELPRNVSQTDALTGNHGHGHYADTNYNLTGGGDTTVNDTTPQPNHAAVGPTSSTGATEEVTTPTLDTAAPVTTSRSLPNRTSDNIGADNKIDSIT